MDEYLQLLLDSLEPSSIVMTIQPRLLLPASYRPDLNLRRYGHRVWAALDPSNCLFDRWQVPEPVAGNEIPAERPVNNSARRAVEAHPTFPRGSGVGHRSSSSRRPSSGLR